MAKKTKSSESKVDPLCILHEIGKMRAELYQEGEGFRVKFVGARAKDRIFDSLPSLLQGLQAIFLEIRMTGEGLRGFDALARAKEDAREDVLAASRKIHSALGTV